MINLEGIRQAVCKSIKDHLNKPVIRSNQNANPPDYPYITYTITTLMRANNGTYGVYVEDDGKGNNQKVYRKGFQQVWSFTVHADNDLTSKQLALELYDYLDEIGRIDLADKGVVIQHIENITNRDTLLTTEYEYRNGFDVVFAFVNEIVDTDTDDVDNYSYNYTQN